jgi:hypothetical protein
MPETKTYKPEDLAFSSLMARVPPDLAEYIETLKQVDQRRDRHPEGDVFTHTRVVTDRVAVHCDIELSIAALMHDLGKDRTTEINERTGMPMSPNHHKYSAECVVIWSEWIRGMGADSYVVYMLVLHHMDKDMAGMKKPLVTPKRMAWLMSQPWWGKLDNLMKADRGGTDVD